jgi:hypothetical protein
MCVGLVSVGEQWRRVVERNCSHQELGLTYVDESDHRGGEAPWRCLPLGRFASVAESRGPAILATARAMS